MHIIIKGVREDSRLTSKDYRPKYLSIVRTYHYTIPSDTCPLGQVRVPYPLWEGVIQPLTITGYLP